MTLDLNPLKTAPRLLFAIPLRPLQGKRFQPTGFPGLGAATFQTPEGTSLLVESAQSMANRLERVVWDESRGDLRSELEGLSHVRVERGNAFLTDSVLEAHRLNSPYVMFGRRKGDDRMVFDVLGEEFNAFEVGPLSSRQQIATRLLRWDVGSLIHGVFLSAKQGKDKTLAGGRIRVSRALSAFIEADGVRVAASGGVKNDHVNPSGVTKEGFGNVPFARDEFTADHTTLYVNLDVGQIRGYGLGAGVEDMLLLLALYKLRLLLEGSLRLRTFCDLECFGGAVVATRPAKFELPAKDDLATALTAAIFACADAMTVTTVTFDAELKKSKDGEAAASNDDTGGEAVDDSADET